MKRIWNYSNDRAGFTLIELIVVVIIVGVLASIALPQYAGFIERARCAEAINAIGAIKVGEQVLRIETGNYGVYTTAALIAAGIGITVDTTNWTYATTSSDTTASVVITATRLAVNGGTAGQTIVLTWTNASQTGVWSGTHPNRPR